MASETFFHRCYDLVKQVPSGRVTTYKAVAEALGTKAYRAVGNAMNRNPHAPHIPCHRVIHSDGRIGGFAFGIAAKIELLGREGIRVRKGKVDDFARHLFDPK